MAKPEKSKDNSELSELLKKLPYRKLSIDATRVINDVIQSCSFLGKYKVPVDDVYAVIRNATEISKVQVEYQLSIYRVSTQQKQVKGVSSIEKYKRACTLVAEALDKFIEEGGELDALKKVLPAKKMTDEQKQQVQKMMTGDLSPTDLIAYLKTIL
ncbi:TPA: hypothetical protein OUE92_003336 [Serratia marcescens]|nr:hypothetical protein [Serratia marcescens]